MLVTKKNNLQELLEEDVHVHEDDMFMRAEMTEKIRAREDCSLKI